MTTPDPKYYEEALAELQSARSEALWIKAMTECDDDESRAKNYYVRERAKALSMCKPLGQPSVHQAEHKADALLKGQKMLFSGELLPSVERCFCRSLSVSKIGKVLCDLHVSPSKLVIVPAAKSREGLAIAGLLLGGGSGALGAIGLELGKLAAGAIQGIQSTSIDKQIPDYLLLLETPQLKFEYREFVVDIGFTGRKWETWVKLSGPGSIGESKGSIAVKFGFEGRLTTDSFAHARVSSLFAHAGRKMEGPHEGNAKDF